MLKLQPAPAKETQPDPFWNNTNSQCSPLAILQAANLYVYTMNNPIRWIDPSGLMALDPTTQALKDRFIATEYGGRVNASEYALAQGAFVTNLNGGGINISHNGTSQNFNLNNGMISVTALNSIFGWNAGFALNAYSERMELHAGTFQYAHYTRFLSENNSLLAHALRYHPLSGTMPGFPDGSEWGTYIDSRIYEDGIRRFWYSTNRYYTHGVRYALMCNAPSVRPASHIARTHTHPIQPNGSMRLGEGQNWPTVGDGNIASKSSINGNARPMYVVTPSRHVLRVCPSIPLNTHSPEGNLLPRNSPYVTIMFTF